VAFVTGHDKTDNVDPTLDWSALARFPGTLVLYMAVSRLPEIVQRLLGEGMPPQTRAIAVHSATTGRQRTVEAPLGELPAAIEHAHLTAPAVVLIGPVVGMRGELDWFEARPLFGRHILVTRPRHQASDMVQRLEELGAVVSALATVEVREPADWGPVDQALTRLSSYQWLVFTSVNGVHALINRLRQLGRDLRVLGHIKFAVIGPATGEALRAYQLEPDLMPGAYRSEALADALKQQAQGSRILLARADRGRELLREELARVADVEQVAVYSQVDVVEPDAAVLAALKRGEVDLIALTSANIARALARLLNADALRWIHSGRTKLVTISPVTSAAVRELGWPIAGEATEYTMRGVTAALIACSAQSVTT
jgi:uroporphyrinogen III methyltransferase/synthase